VALESIALSAADAPEMLGLSADDFGAEWKRVVEDVFESRGMYNMALDILKATLDDDILSNAISFYGSDLGQRLVDAENATHMDEDDNAKQQNGANLVAEMVRTASPRVDYLRRMGDAIDSSGTSVRAVQEIQIRFLLAASAQGVVALKMDETDLRELMKKNEPEMRRSLALSALAASAHAYRDFSDADLLAYTEVLESQEMRTLYELMNAVQYEIMANRFEALAARMAKMRSGQDI